MSISRRKAIDDLFAFGWKLQFLLLLSPPLLNESDNRSTSWKTNCVWLHVYAGVRRSKNQFQFNANSRKMCLCADLVTTNNKCVLHSLKYMCFNGLRHFVLLASHVIKCVDYKVVAIDLILMFGRVVCVCVCEYCRPYVRVCVFNLMSITYKQDILQTACSNENVKISHIYRL